MKNILLLIFIFIFMSCETKNEEKKISKVEYPFEAIYSSDVSMGDPNLANIVLGLQEAANEGNFEKTMSYLHDEFQGTLEDGTTVNKQQLEEMYKPIFENSKIEIDPMAWFTIHINDLNHDWVILWTKEDYISSSDTTSVYAQESFQIQDGKIIGLNQFQRPIK